MLAMRVPLLIGTATLTTASTSPRRLVVSGAMVSSSEAPDVPITLKGFNWGFKENALSITDNDRNVSRLFPGANVARLVMNHWHDAADAVDGPAKGDCNSNNRSTGYLTLACLDMFDKVIDWITGEAKSWAVITARAAMAAGDGGDGKTVFTNSTLWQRMIAMWGFLAKRYRHKDGLAGFEVMSEPRTENQNGVVHKFHVDACNAVWKEDPAAVCFVGPAKFYDRNQLGPEYIVKGGPVIYAANFFCPSNWITGKYKGVAYGGSGKCCDIGSESKDCQSGCDEVITLNKKYLAMQLTSIDTFRSKFKVPVLIDQWGVHQDIGGGAQSQRQYLADLLDLFEKRQYHTSYWWYRDPTGAFSGCEGGYEIYCQPDPSKSVHWNQVAIEQLGTYMSGISKQAYV